MIKNNKNDLNRLSGNFVVQIREFEEMQNLEWMINRRLYSKIISIFNQLPASIKGVPDFSQIESFRYFIIGEKGISLMNEGNIAVGFIGNIIHIRMDGLNVMTNEILRTCPADLYRNVSNLLHVFRTKTQDINPISNEIVNNLKRVKI
jgi:hypothetical protein